ncbi:T9SS type A sorting domain-containing protein [Aestuariivivens sediminis]|uniref:T9SS type A sorting domain-containing protein n=1 Tax=Aestuariivivens sediminis TaxID=2913557 RepID=UPI001F58A01C|nr:T9SS type A sorting domain-containing protein [Aestuariivivens sediminis]
MKEKIHVLPSNLFYSEPQKLLLIFLLTLLGIFALQAQNTNASDTGHEHADENATVYGGDLTFADGETYTSVCVGDGEADYIWVHLENESGRVKQWIITDEAGNIAALPDDIESYDFDEDGVGISLIYHLSYNGIKPLVDPSGQGKFTINVDDIVGKFDLSDPITVERFLQPVGGTLEGGPFEFCVGDGEADHIPEGAITLSGNMGTNSAWVVTDIDGNILGLPESPYDVNFDEAPAGTCLVWHLSYEDNVSLDITNASELMGCFALTNPIEVFRYQQPTAGTLEGGPFNFCVGDGEADHIPEGAITLSGNMGTNLAWVVTDIDGNILGLPESPYDVNFDEAPAGTCLVWHLSYEDNVSLDITNASELMGCFALTNPIEVFRYQQPTAGTLEGGPFNFCVGDGEADQIEEGAITLSGNSGTNAAWVVTDADGNILALPDSPYDVNFDEAPAGTCLVWHLSYEDNVSFDGVANAADLMGCFALSNPVTVNRTSVNGGTLTGGEENSFSFTVGDGTSDTLADGALTLEGNVGTNSAWVLTNEDATVILALPTNYTDIDFDGTGEGVSKLWHLSYEDGLEGLTPPDEGDHLVSGLSGACFDLSNAITINKVTASSIAIYPNPTETSVSVDLSHFSGDYINISLFNLKSSRLFNQQYSFKGLSKIQYLDVSDYDAGLYFVKVTNLQTGATAVKPLVIN